jgi:hypothetical protein
MPKKAKVYKYNSVRVYFKQGDELQMQVYKDLQALAKSLGVSLSTASGMSMRRGVSLVRKDWDELQKRSTK